MHLYYCAVKILPIPDVRLVPKISLGNSNNYMTNKYVKYALESLSGE